MRVELSQGTLLYEGKNGFIRSYQTNWDAAYRQAEEYLKWAKDHKQPSKEYIVLDIATGRLQVLTIDDVEEDNG